MKTLTDEKLTIVGAAGMIGSNMAQTAIMMGLLLIFVCMTRTLLVWKGWLKSCSIAVSRALTLHLLPI